MDITTPLAVNMLANPLTEGGLALVAGLCGAEASLELGRLAGGGDIGGAGRGITLRCEVSPAD
jgi:hypothetical protein